MAAFMVDSAVPATDLVQPQLTVWDDVVAWAGGPPRVWGRYLGDGYGAAVPLSAAEAHFLVNTKRCAILPIYNMATAQSVAGGYASGQGDANKALEAATGLGVPAGTYLACDIEYGWPLSTEWISGWADTMRNSAYGGSGVLYGALASAGFARPFLAALSNPNVARLLLWAAEPQTGPSTTTNMPPWNPAPPSADTAGMVHFWQYARGAYGGVADLDAVDETLLSPPLWAPAWWT